MENFGLAEILLGIMVLVLFTSIFGYQTYAQEADNTTKTVDDKEKRVIILYKNYVEDKDVDELKEKFVKIKKKYKIIPAVAAFVDQKWIADIKSKKNVIGVFDDMTVHSMLDGSVSQINANLVHSSGNTGSGVPVCIVDTGVEDKHKNLNSLVVEYDFVNGDNNAYDNNGHGTHVAGIVASTHSTYGGVAYGATLMAAKVLDGSGSGWFTDVISGIEWCVDNGAKVISMSLE